MLDFPKTDATVSAIPTLFLLCNLNTPSGGRATFLLNLRRTAWLPEVIGWQRDTRGILKLGHKKCHSCLPCSLEMLTLSPCLHARRKPNQPAEAHVEGNQSTQPIHAAGPRTKANSNSQCEQAVSEVGPPLYIEQPQLKRCRTEMHQPCSDRPKWQILSKINSCCYFKSLRFGCFFTW